MFVVVLAFSYSCRVLGGDSCLVKTASLKELNRLRAGPSFPAPFSSSLVLKLPFVAFESLIVLGEVLGNRKLAKFFWGKSRLGDTKGFADR